jgi:hypothetical protein
MAVVSIERRLAKLESKQPAGLAALMDDELAVMQLDLLQRMAAAEDASTEERAAAQVEASKIEDRIRASIARRAMPGYERHLEYCRQAWAKRRPDQDYIPALICGESGMGEYDGWDRPHVMAWRAEMHGRFATGAIG